MWWLTAAAWACSGPGAMEKIAYAERLGLGLAIATAVMGIIGAGLVARRGHSCRPVAPLILVTIAHPGLWMGARRGDCGQTLQLASIVFTIIGLALLGWVAARPRILERMDEAE